MEKASVHHVYTEKIQVTRGILIIPWYSTQKRCIASMYRMVLFVESEFNIGCGEMPRDNNS